MQTKQLLLNPDGSLPNNITIDIIEKYGLTPTMPTPRWRPSPGMILIEDEPQQDENGVWRQVWVEVPQPVEPEQEPPVN